MPSDQQLRTVGITLENRKFCEALVKRGQFETIAEVIRIAVMFSKTLARGYKQVCLLPKSKKPIIPTHCVRFFIDPEMKNYIDACIGTGQFTSISSVCNTCLDYYRLAVTNSFGAEIEKLEKEYAETIQKLRELKANAEKYAASMAWYHSYTRMREVQEEY